LVAGCSPSDGDDPEDTAIGQEASVPTSPTRQTAFRVRTGFTADLNADAGWAAGINEPATVPVEQPFRLRFEVETSAGAPPVERFRLQYRHNEGDWKPVRTADFPYPSEETPSVSIVSTEGYDAGAKTTDLLTGSEASYRGGAGVQLSDVSPVLDVSDGQSEWEWPLVVRRYADEAQTTKSGDTVAFRMVSDDGGAVSAQSHATVTVSVPPRFLGGTFVETPGRVGPWEASNGDLYFLMEPAETYNVLMTVKSSDGGRTWAEADGANRPATGDLEGFASAQHDDTLHMLHQIDEGVFYHAFRTSDHPTAPNTWSVRDDTVATPGEPPVQVASLAARPDGGLVAVYGGPDGLRMLIRAPDGDWGTETVFDADSPHPSSGPQTVLGDGNTVHVAYTDRGGHVWYRQVRPDGSLTPRVQVTSEVGTDEADIGSVLPLVFLPETNTVVVLYRRADGTLWERSVLEDGTLSEASQVTDRKVVQNAVDSDQAGADAIAAGGSVHVLFIAADTGHIYHTQRDAAGSWSNPERLVDGVNAQWIRGRPLRRDAEAPSVYGFVYDAGSNGGSGMNWYAEHPLTRTAP
jgi:hypothetical protein